MLHTKGWKFVAVAQYVVGFELNHQWKLHFYEFIARFYIFSVNSINRIELELFTEKVKKNK